MLTISAELAAAFESDALARWKAEIAADLRQRYPAVMAGFPEARLQDWVRSAMETVRRHGATGRADLWFFTVTLFTLTEVDHDDPGASDFAAIMAGPGTYAAKTAMLRKSFPQGTDAT